MLGSVAERVLDQAPCPVATVRSGFSGALRRFVCGADLADAAPLAAGVALARAAGAEVLVLHAVPELPDHGARGLVPPSTRDGLLAEAKASLAAALAALDTTGVTVRSSVVPGRAHRQLVRHAVEESADLVVVGVHPHLFGSTAHHVVRSSDVPVLTVRGPAPDEESPE
jgi:nucleotide-binding universal stress UspA family protein